MKIKTVFPLLCPLLMMYSCSNKPQPVHAYSYLHELTDSLKLNKVKNIIIFSINPNDCINCLRGFSTINESLKKIANSKVYVMLMEREIEKQELIHTTQNISFKDSVNKVVIWNKEVYKKISALTGNKILVSLFTVYNYKTDSVIYSSPIKSIADVRQLDVFLK